MRWWPLMCCACAASVAEPMLDSSGRDSAGVGGDGDVPVPSVFTPPEDWGAGFADVSGSLREDLPFDPGSAKPKILNPSWHLIAMGDVDGDGIPQVVVTHRAQESGLPPVRRAYRWEDAGLVADEVLQADLDVHNSEVVGLVDLDGDGRIDQIGHRLSEWVRYGRETGGFTDPHALEAGWSDASFLAGMSLFDVDRDGWLDIVIGASGCAGELAVMRRTGLREWTLDTERMQPWGTPLRTDAIQSLRLSDGRHAHVAVAASCEVLDAHPGFVVEKAHDGPYVPTPLTGPDAWWKLQPATAGAPFTRVMPMGAAVADLDQDGFLDLSLSLAAPWLAVLQGDGQGGFTTVLTPGMEFPTSQRQPTIEQLGWAIQPLDLDLDGRMDLLVTLGDDESSFLGSQGETFGAFALWNGGEFDMWPVAADIGLADVGSMRGLIAYDVGSDGDADLLMAGFGGPSRAVENRIATGGQGLSVGLRGTVSNHLGIGARVRVMAAGLNDQVAMMGQSAGVNGLVPTQLFFGMGEADLAEVRVDWPSGIVQTLTEVEPGQHLVIEEPRVVDVMPASRHVLADGTDEASVWVRPERGGLAEVVVRVDGEPQPLEASEKGVFVARWSRTKVGAAVIEVRIDGEPLEVRPRVWFDSP